jgi:photosystem II protein
MATMSITASPFVGTMPQGLPALRSSRRCTPLQVVASKKVNVKEPFGPGGGAKFRQGVDASGRVAKGKGVYQFAKKYGANVDGYSPIYAPEEWSASGDSYVGGVPALTIWATLLGGLLVGGAFLVYSTSALAS